MDTNVVLFETLLCVVVQVNPPKQSPSAVVFVLGVSLHSYLPAHRSGMIPVHPRATDAPPGFSSDSQTNETQLVLVSKRRLPELSHVDTDHDTR